MDDSLFLQHHFFLNQAVYLDFFAITKLFYNNNFKNNIKNNNLTPFNKELASKDK